MLGNAPYVKVLKDLERRRAGLAADLERIQTECAEVDSLIIGIRKLAYPSLAAHPHAQGDHAVIPAKPPAGSIRSMSMRWAILTLFGKDGTKPLNVGGVLQALRETGFPITDKTRGNVSAVLSRMVGFGEVTNAGNSYAITEQGKRSLQVIAKRQSELLENVEEGDSEEVPEGE